MMYALLSLVLMAAKPAPAPTTQPATAENKILAAVMDVRAKQIEIADRQYKTAVDNAAKSHAQAVDGANKNAVKTLISHARTFTQSGKLAEAITAYKLICRFEPTHPEALAALKSVGITPEAPQAAADPATPAAGGATKTAAAAGNPPAAQPAAPAVEHTWQQAVQCPVDSSQWITVVQLTQGQTVDFTVTGAWTLNGKEIGPQGIPAEGVVLHGRVSTMPNTPFVIEPKGSFKAPVAGLLQVLMTMPEARRKDAKGRLQILVAIRK
ncbi:MAG: hypothetical protein ABFD92_03315 [Planctomycetaceae bacterium]|nr:hypothetical protein [Planctomycetaceae bacterium]